MANNSNDILQSDTPVIFNNKKYQVLVYVKSKEKYLLRGYPYLIDPKKVKLDMPKKAT